MFTAFQCNHANEVPAACSCKSSCYCKTHTCKQRNSPFEDEVTGKRTNRITGIVTYGSHTKIDPFGYIVNDALIREVREGRWVTGMLEALCDEVERLQKLDAR